MKIQASFALGRFKRSEELTIYDFMEQSKREELKLPLVDFQGSRLVLQIRVHQVPRGPSAFYIYADCLILNHTPYELFYFSHGSNSCPKPYENEDASLIAGQIPGDGEAERSQ